MITVKNKTCSKCKILKDISNFTISKRAKDELSHRCKECDKVYYFQNHEKNLKRNKEYNKKNYIQLKEYKKQYYLKNKEKFLIGQKLYRQEHKKELQIYHRNYKNNRKKIDLNYKLAMTLRSRLYSAIKSNSKAGSAVRDLGCTISELKIYLESKFLSDMTWENHNLYGWHIDHIIPLSKFDLTNRKQFLKAVHYTNLQPMWAKDNLNKHAKIICQK